MGAKGNARSLKAFVLVAVLVASVFWGNFAPLSLTASAATGTGTTPDKGTTIEGLTNNVTVRDAENSRVTEKIKMGQRYTIEFNFVTDDADFITLAKKLTNSVTSLDNSAFSISSNGWLTTADSTLVFLKSENVSDTTSDIRIYAKISNIECNKLHRSFDITDIDINRTFTPPEQPIKADKRIIRSITIPENYFTTPAPTTTGEEEEKPVESSTILENYTITDKSGSKLEKVDKGTKAFNLTVVYLEYGLEKVEVEDMSSGDFSVFFGNMGGFFSDTGTRGKLERITSSANGIPRFRATFTGLTYNEDEGTNTVELKMVYDIKENYTQGTLPLIVKQAKVKDDKDKDKEISPLKPYIIIDKFSYGGKEIEAGATFALDITYSNTSSTIGLENIVVTITPPEDSITIASSSNTIYVAAMPPKGSLSHKIELQALPNAKVGSAEVTVSFTYQYVDTINKVREEVKDLAQKISIPLMQLDRFALDPLKNIPYAEAGVPFYLPIEYKNSGKSITYNITATAESKTEIEAKPEHGKNLEAGGTDSLEIEITAPTAGELSGDVIVKYEDEGGNAKELRQPFSLLVNEPYVPDQNEGMGEQAPPEDNVSPLTTVLIVVGSLFIAAPIAYFFFKRSKKKEGVGFDEDF